MYNIYQLLRKTELRIASSISDSFKVGRCLLSLSGVAPVQHKTATYQSSEIDMVMKSELAKAGIHGLDINWGSVFISPINKMRHKRRWSKSVYSEVLDAVFEDILMGVNLDTGGEWSSGPLVRQVQKWIDQGKDSTDITKLVKTKVWKEAIKKKHTLSEGMVDTHLTGYETVSPDNASEVKGQVFLDVLSLTPLNQAKASEWMHMVDTDPETRLLLRKIDDVISKGTDESLHLLWSVLKDVPDFKSRKDIAEEMVTIPDEYGQNQRIPLWQALGKRKPNDIWFEFGKLEKTLERLKPHVMEALTN